MGVIKNLFLYNLKIFKNLLNLLKKIFEKFYGFRNSYSPSNHFSLELQYQQILNQHDRLVNKPYPKNPVNHLQLWGIDLLVSCSNYCDTNLKK